MPKLCLETQADVQFPPFSFLEAPGRRTAIGTRELDDSRIIAPNATRQHGLSGERNPEGVACAGSGRHEEPMGQ